MSSGPNASVYMARAVLMGGAERGLSPPELCALVGIRPEVVASDEGRVPAPAMMALWEEVPRLSGDLAFGLHLGERVSVPPHPVLGYAMRQSATFGEALECFFRFQRILQSVAHVEIGESSDARRMTVRGAPGIGKLPRHAVEYGFSSTLALGRELTGVADIVPRAVYFAHPEPPDRREHERIFRAPVHFGAGDHAMDFDASVLALPLPAADPALRRVLEGYARHLASQLPEAPSVSARVRRALHDALHGGRTELASIAKSLHMSERTLQRRLRDEGTSHQALLDEERARLAKHYVRSSTLSFQEIAFMLGFSEQAAFHRAFVRWTGQTPGRARGTR